MEGLEKIHTFLFGKKKTRRGHAFCTSSYCSKTPYDTEIFSSQVFPALSMCCMMMSLFAELCVHMAIFAKQTRGAIQYRLGFSVGVRVRLRKKLRSNLSTWEQEV